MKDPLSTSGPILDVVQQMISKNVAISANQISTNSSNPERRRHCQLPSCPICAEIEPFPHYNTCEVMLYSLLLHHALLLSGYTAKPLFSVLGQVPLQRSDQKLRVNLLCKY